MIGALCESPLTFEALTVWRDELNEGKVLLRDIIDLEATYGAGPEGQAAAAAAAAAAANAVGPDGKPLPPPMHIPGVNNGAPVPFAVKPPAPPPPPPKPVVKDGEEVDPGEAAAAADAANDDDGFEDEGNLPLSAMEAALKPQVSGDARPDREPLQETRQAAGRVG
ncbi:MAG: hypothetical protein WDM89_11625 [Rhizomicrobium sp.]